VVHRVAWFLIALAFLARTAPALAQPPAAAEWDIRVSAATYVLTDEDNYVQPTVTADHGALHLESRYNYEERRAVSAFVGWNARFGETTKLELTPMIGGVVGGVDGVIPALVADFSWRRIEAYAEAEFLIDVRDISSSFVYSWSELSVWPTERFRAGGVVQRTRVLRTPREVQRGVLVGAAASRVEGTVYYFNPGSDDQFLVVSIGIRF
jgi:hypothetical protein